MTFIEFFISLETGMTCKICSRGYKKRFPCSAENANICWHFNIYQQEKQSDIGLSEPEKAEFPEHTSRIYFGASVIPSFQK